MQRQLNADGPRISLGNRNLRRFSSGLLDWKEGTRWRDHWCNLCSTDGSDVTCSRRSTPVAVSSESLLQSERGIPSLKVSERRQPTAYTLCTHPAASHRTAGSDRETDRRTSGEQRQGKVGECGSMRVESEDGPTDSLLGNCGASESRRMRAGTRAPPLPRRLLCLRGEGMQWGSERVC